MEHFLFLWSFPFALLGLLLLSSMSAFLQAPNALRIIGGILLVPSVLSGVFLIILTQKSLLVVGGNWSLIPLNLHGVISSETAFFLASLTLALTATLFLMPSNRLVQTVKLCSLCFFILLLLASIVNCFIAWTFFSLGSFVLSYCIIKESERKGLDDDVGELFLWHRLSDLFLFISLLLIAIKQQTLSLLLLPKLAPQISPLIIVVFFLALIFRLIPLSRRRTLATFSDFRASFLEDCYVSLGIAFLLLRMSDIIFLSEEANYFLITASLLIFLRSLMAPLSNPIFIFKTINTFLVCLTIILICYQQYYAVQAVLLVLTLLPPLALLVADHKERHRRFSMSAEPYFDPLDKLVGILRSALAFAAESSSNFTGPFYGNFLLYRLPQFMVTLCEMPFRLFHNGSIQRSLLFIIVSLATYYWWWER